MSLIALLFTLAAHSVCPFHRPADGPVLRPYAPQGDYGGHWGVDIAASPGSPVVAAAAGTVTFSGRIAGRLSVTVLHGGGVRTSYSYLGAALVAPGSAVAAGTAVGVGGVDHGAVHFSLRIGDRYVAPLLEGCRLVPGRGVRLRGP